MAGFIHQTDLELVQLAKQGSLEAFETLTARYESRIYALALRILRQEQDAEDVTQQTFLSMLENLGGFRAESSFSTWLMRVATHASLKVIRKRKGLEMISLESGDAAEEDYGSVPRPSFIADWKQSPESIIHRNEIRQLLENALGELDEMHRMVFLLRDVEGLSIKETAEALDLSEANVKIRLLRARLQLRENLTEALGDPSTRVMRHHAH